MHILLIQNTFVAIDRTDFIASVINISNANKTFTPIIANTIINICAIIII